MRGCITHRADGTYAAVIELSRGPDGRRRHKWFGGYRTRKGAQAKLNELMAELQANTFVAPSTMTLADYLRRWLAESAAPRLAGRSLERTRCIVERHLTPELGGYRLSELRPLHIQSYLTQARTSGRKSGHGGLAGATLLKHFEVLHSALGQAVKWELIPRNPASAVDRPRVGTRPGQAIRALSAEEVAELLAAAAGTRLYTPILVAVTTGLRRGELLALHWADLDLDKGTLSVNCALEETGAGISFKAPKTAQSRRTMPLPATTVQALRDHHRAQAELKLRAGPAYGDQDLVFATPLGAPWIPSNFGRTFRTFKTRHGYSFRFHDLRHTHASLLLALGVHVKVVQERLGHASVTMTMDTYSHLLPGVQEAAIDAFEATLASVLQPAR
jgi:integrase